MACPWPGNVRELQNVLREAVLAEDGRELQPSSLPEGYRLERLERSPKPPEAHTSLAALEREHIFRVLESADGNISRAARILGVTRTTIHRKLKAYRHLPPGVS